MIEIKFSQKAILDLQQTKEYIADELCSEQAALNTLSKITKKISTLAYFPELGSSLSSVMDIETDYRFLLCSNYIAFYRMENQTIFVVRILYKRRNFMQILFGKQ